MGRLRAWIAGVLICLLGLASPGSPWRSHGWALDTPNERVTLAGLTGVHVVVHEVGGEAEREGLSRLSLQADVEQRLRVAKLIRSAAEEKEKPFFVVDHDMLFIDVISDRLIAFDGIPGKTGEATAPLPMAEGMNLFLKGMDVTFRRDKVSGRPRINKPGSQLDREQKENGKYYYAE